MIEMTTSNIEFWFITRIRSPCLQTHDSAVFVLKMVLAVTLTVSAFLGAIRCNWKLTGVSSQILAGFSYTCETESFVHDLRRPPMHMRP